MKSKQITRVKKGGINDDGCIGGSNRYVAFSCRQTQPPTLVQVEKEAPASVPSAIFPTQPKVNPDFFKRFLNTTGFC